VARRAAKGSEPAEVVLTDPAEVRALAHPARLAVIDALYAGEVLTATELAERGGVSPSAMSYHLRALEKAGLVVRADARGDGRERPWKRAGAALRIDVARSGDGGANAVGLNAAELLVTSSLDADRQRLLDSIRADARRPKGEGLGSHYARDSVLLTPEEMREVSDAIDALLTPYRRGVRTDAPDDVVPYAASIILAPLSRSTERDER
jgi:DNA-binding transcriptional ArsR family regulator